MNIPDLIGMVIGALLTLMVFSYLIGDNGLFRFAIHLFIGVAAGFASAVAVRNVILPQLILPLVDLALGRAAYGSFLSLVPFVLSALLFAKASNRFQRLGNVSMAFLVGIGAAAAVGGAVLGTIFPQTTAAMNLLDFSSIQAGDNAERIVEIISRLISLVGTLATLIYFHFSILPSESESGVRNPLIERIGKIGQGFIAVTFGVMFAGVFSATVTALIERIQSLWTFVLTLMDLFT